MQTVDESVKERLSGQGKDISLFKVFLPESALRQMRGKKTYCQYDNRKKKIEDGIVFYDKIYA